MGENLTIDWHIDAERENIPYLTFSVYDGESNFAISERSTGFRWFFAFLLFTGFKRAAERPMYFLFDEPAANLHAKAQAELLRHFEKIATGGNRIIYTTHSHHMINPRWLSGSYIVENKAIDYERNKDLDLDNNKTEIRALGYRNFVSQYGSRVSYFQPVVERLDYVAPELIRSSPFLILEGITDYYALTFVRLLDSKRPIDFALLPGSGAGSSSPLIGYLLGRGDRFMVLLDDDKAGRNACKRYRDSFYLNESTIRTVGELSEKYEGMKLENIIDKKSTEMIGQHIGKQEASKKDVGLYLAELCANRSTENVLSVETKDLLIGILDLCSSILHGSDSKYSGKKQENRAVNPPA